MQGRFLYKHIHKLHHKSYNTTAFSGTSFHPIENTIFLSAGFLAVPFGVHPVVFVALMVDCGFAAWLGHGGFVFPGPQRHSCILDLDLDPGSF